MKANTNQKKMPAYYFFTGIAFLILGLGNTTLLVRADSIYDILIGITGVPLILGAVILLNHYKGLGRTGD